MDTTFRCSTVFRVRLPTDTKPTGKQKQPAPSKGGRPCGSITQRRIVLWSPSEFGLPSNSTGIHTENKQQSPDCHRRSLQGRQHAAVPRLLCQLAQVFSLGGKLQSVQHTRWPAESVSSSGAAEDGKNVRAWVALRVFA